MYDNVVKASTGATRVPGLYTTADTKGRLASAPRAAADETTETPASGSPSADPAPWRFAAAPAPRPAPDADTAAGAPEPRSASASEARGERGKTCSAGDR